MTLPEDRYSFNTNADVRRQGRRTIDDWFELNWAEPQHASRFASLFMETGRLERHFRPEGRQKYAGAALTRHYASMPRELASWAWREREVYATQYPQVFWALAEGEGVYRQTERHFKNSFAMVFVIDEGKIRLLREWSDPIPWLEARGVHVPELPTRDA